jgi:hypothetical protein
LVEDYPFYAKFAKEVPGYKILDNSLIELGGSVDLKRILTAAEAIGADEIILPDVFQKGPETIEVVNASLDVIKEIYSDGCPFKLMAVAQGRDEEEWYECYKTLLNNPYIDVISIPKVLAKMHPQGRPHFVNEFCDVRRKPHHLLGLWYSIHELNEYKLFDDIRSCDTVLFGYMAKYGLSRQGTRPDGYTVDLVMDVIDYSKVSDPFRNNIGRLRI